MKTYTECEQEIANTLQQLTKAYDGSPDRMPFALSLAIGLAVQLRYEIECIKDQSNTREMHALLERLGGK